MRDPHLDKVLEFLKKYIARHGIPQTKKTDLPTSFCSNKFAEFCTKRCIKHIECLIRDTEGNGKIERLIRTENKILRANKENLISKDNTELSGFPFALRMNPSANNKSPYERYTGREPNTIKRISTYTSWLISEAPAFGEEGFESGQDSTIIVRERARGAKLEGAYKKRKGDLLEQSNHKILTFLPAGGTQSTKISKRDVGRLGQQPCCSQ